MKNDLIDPELFGNEAGEDEPYEILSSYFLEKDEQKTFFSDRQRLGFVRSRKGVGKSALLRQTLYKRQLEKRGEILIFLKASDLTALQEPKDESALGLINLWQQRICSRINLEIGSTLKIAFSDDKTTLVESAEIAGFRGKNILGSLIDRLKVKGAGIEISREKLSQANSEELLKRILDNKISVWILIDDIDATFINNEKEKLKVSTFFTACRNLVNNTSGLYIRASVRTDVWTILRNFDEALDKCEQYMYDLKWSTTETGKILENKIISYFKRTYTEEKYHRLQTGKHSKDIFRLVFKEPFTWGNRKVDAFRPIHILSGGRPRWAAQLCKLAAKDAYKKNNSIISINHVSSVLVDYGKARLSDLYKEHNHQCNILREIIETFSGGKTLYKTKDLLSHVDSKIISRTGMPIIDGKIDAENNLIIANFLYRIGFITIRDTADRTGIGFVRYEDRPDLLTSNVNLDDGMDWEIHPSYRQVLRIK